MRNKFEDFAALHMQVNPLILGNVWNAQSATIFEKQGFSAIGTSSASVAETLGYEDGEQMSFDEYLFVIRHIARNTKLPLTVDLEAGYADTPQEITANIFRLYELGVCGVNLEDSIIVAGKRGIVDAYAFAQRIAEIITLLKTAAIKVFINIRTDAFLLGLSNALAETISRAEQYQKAGAHGLFVPCITNIEHIKTVTEKSTLPLNVMCMPALPDFDELEKAGVKRISMGPFLSKHIYQNLATTSAQIIKERTFGSLF